MTETSLPVSRRRTRLGTASWAMFDWAAQPFYIIIGGFIFGPYLVNEVIGGEGMKYWGYALSIGGFVTAIFAPIFGAIADKGGRRKPWLAAFSLSYVLSVGILWFAQPGDMPGVLIFIPLVIMAGASVEFSAVFTNAMLPDVVSKERMGQLSGFAFALGYIGGFVAMLVLIYAILPDTENVPRLPYEPAEPLFDLDISKREDARAAAPFSALWFLVFILPLFFFTPDRKASGKPFGQAIGEGVGMLKRTVLLLPKKVYKNLSLFLLSRMLFNDGLNALFAFGMIYASKILNWSTHETGLAGIFLAVAAAFGAMIGGILDDWIGPKNTVIYGVCLLILGTIGVSSIGADTILFFIPVSESNGGGFMSSAREWTYLASSALVGLGAGPAQSASRTMMVRLSPLRQMTEAMGLLALSGRVTAFLAPLAIGLMTDWFNERVAIVSILFFLVGGLLLILPVKLVRVPDFDTAKV